ncbi:MAG TPA: hypothetical protein VE422_47365 [Terriglobia bacterium]|nr:hypothetical protein [Terriglobia bacterium]
MSKQVKKSNQTAAKTEPPKRFEAASASLDSGGDTQRDTVTLSVRLTEEQRERLVTAANFRGWTPTTLLRISAMEKAAHILNTATPTNIDLRKMAQAVAGRLMGERKQLTIKELKELKMGAHYGGSEFLNMIIDGCMTVVARTQSDLPNPVDPTV